MPFEKPYYPKLSNLITLDNIPSALDFIRNIAQNIFNKIHYKNYQSSISPLGESAFYSLSIVTKDRLDFELFYGLKFVLNRDQEDTEISAFPVTPRSRAIVSRGKSLQHSRKLSGLPEPPYG